MTESCCNTNGPLATALTSGLVVIVASRLISRSWVVLTLFVSVPVSLADTGFVDNAALTLSTVEAVWVAKAGGVTVKVCTGEAFLAIVPTLQVIVAVPALKENPPAPRHVPGSGTVEP